MAFELAYLKLGVHRSMAWHSCQVTYYNISSPCRAHQRRPAKCARSRSRPRIDCSTPSRALYGAHRASRASRLSPTYADSKHAYVRVISLICMCSSSKGEQNHPNIFTCANRMYSQCKMHPPPSTATSSSPLPARGRPPLGPFALASPSSRSSAEKFRRGLE